MASWTVKFRDWRRARHLRRHTAAHGDRYTAYGLELRVPAHVSTGVRYVLARGKPYEAEEAAYIRQALPEGTHVLELGGSIGVVSRVIRATIGPAARHLIVEANPDLAPICRDNAQRDTQGAVTEVIQGAVAYTDAATVRFARGDTHHTGHVAQQGDGDTFEAPALRLADLVTRMPPGPFALVSDIEGGEYDMLMQEDAETFSRISHAVMEIHPRAFAAMGGSEDAFLFRLDQLGFDVLDRTADVILLRGPAGES